MTALGRARLAAIYSVTLAFALSGVASAAPDSQHWIIQALPTPAVAPNGQLTGIACASATNCLAVGNAQDTAGRDAMLTETWNGQRWEGQPAPFPNRAIGAFLTGVSCTSVNACIAVGDVLTDANRHLPLAERWSDDGWDLQSVPTPDGATDSFLSGVSCASRTACVAVGYSRNAAGHKETLAEHWNGRTWQVQSTANVSNASDSALSDVSCSSASACTAVGNAATGSASQGMIERWNGTSWAVQVGASPGGSSGTSLAGVSCSTATACMAVGSFAAKSTKAGGTLAERWDGASWTVAPTPSETLDILSSVSCTMPTACTAVGKAGFSAPIVERWDGTSWTIQASPSPSGAAQAGLVAVACPTESACTAVGAAQFASGGGTNLTLAERWSSAGWDIQASFNPLGQTRNGLVGVACATAYDCTAVGYAFNNNGVSQTLAERWNGNRWSIAATPNPQGAASSGLSGVACATRDECTAVGTYADNNGVQRTLIEHWNGEDWRIQPSPAPVGASASALYAVACAPDAACTAAGAATDADGTTRTLIERSDGANWEVQPSPNPTGAVYVGLQGVSCPIARNCTAVGLLVDSNFNFLTIAEHWDGTTWEIQPTPNPVGTNGPNGTLEGGVSCPTIQSCTAVGQWSPAPAPHPGITLAEQWNGSSWSVQPTPNPAMVDGVNGTQDDPFAGVSCSATNTCTAVGSYASADSNGDFLALIERWNGTSWSVQAAATPVGAFVTSLAGVACPTANVCMAVGNSSRYNPATKTSAPNRALAERSGGGGD